MKTFDYRKSILERKYNKEKFSDNAIALASFCWLHYKLEKDEELLREARDFIDSSSKINFASQKLIYYKVFLLIESDMLGEAAELLSAIKPYRNYYKSNDSVMYGAYLFLDSIIMCKKGKKRGVKKQFNALVDYCEDDKNVIFDLFLGIINYHLGDYSEAIDNFSHAYKGKMRSPYLYIYVLECLDKADKTTFKIDKNLLYGSMKWAIKKDYDLNGLIVKYKDIIVNNFDNKLLNPEELYRYYPLQEILYEIADGLMDNFDFSDKAFFYYKEAEVKQLEIPHLYYSLIKAAYANKIEDITRYSLEKYLEEWIDEKELLHFVYHLIVTKDDNRDLLEKYRDDIIYFGKKAIGGNEKGRYYNSIYRYCLLNKKELDSNEAIKMKRFLYQDLFKYRVFLKNPGKTKYLWTFQKELKEISKYVIEGNSFFVRSFENDFELKFLDENQKNITNPEYTIEKYVEKADIDLYMDFFNDDYTSPELFIVLAKHYMTYDELPEESLAVFKSILTERSISDEFKMVVAAATGNYYADHNNYKLASSYYVNVDENILSDKYIERMMLAYINGKEYKKAVNIIIKKAELISDRNLFYALKMLARFKIYDEYIADVAYELILKSWFDKQLVEIVFKYYQGSQEEWMELNRTLTRMSFSNPWLDEIILKNAVWMNIFDDGSQSVWRRMYEMNGASQLVLEYMELCLYKILTDNARPNTKTIETLEDMFSDNNDDTIAFALATVYIKYDIVTDKSEEIIKSAMEKCEEKGIIFPIFKQIKDKRLMIPYIEINQPFVYKKPSNKNLVFYYKFDDDEEFRKKEMKYYKFGLYFVAIPHFYGETLIYYFSEEMATGSVVTKSEQITNNDLRLSDNKDNSFYVINNALIYENMFKYEKVEEIITDRLKEKQRIKSWIM